MKRISAIIFGAWLGMQLGFVGVVSPVLFTHDILDNHTATRLISQLFDVANMLGLVASILLLLQNRQHAYFARANSLRKWLILLMILLVISLFALSSAVNHHPEHTLVAWLGGSLGMWRGSLHLLNGAIGLLGLGVAIRVLRLEN